jgi:hypothetical protein
MDADNMTNSKTLKKWVGIGIKYASSVPKKG